MFKSNENPQFRNQLSETIFKQKYAHQGAETWAALCRTLVDDVCGELLTKEENDQLYEYMRDLKFLAGGRYLYYAGRPMKFFNNCFSAGTKVLTDTGWRNVEELGEANVYSVPQGGFLPATFNEHGEQTVYKLVFKPVRGRSNVEYVVKATRNHKWLLKNGTTTEDIRVGDVVPASTKSLGDKSSLGFVHGFVFGDGNRNGQLRLCGAKGSYLETLQQHGTISYPESAKGDPMLYFNQELDWKNLPPEDSTPEYIASFIEGWIAADGCNNHILNSVDLTAMEWFRKYAAYAGLVLSGNLREQVRDTSIGGYSYKDHKIYIQNYSRGGTWKGFKLVSIEEVGVEKVYCPFEPVHNQIVIDHGIHTYQCYLLRAEEDTREDWADLSWKSESALMSGGGIGVDYSRYRPSGSTIRRTGGSASGPIPKMLMINEIGRRVMQGGSRRSAIYASLNWKHQDIPQFLNIKNWDATKVPGTSLTLKDLKALDFDWPAPLDMTNISVNYDTEWYLNSLKGDLGETFLTNVRQAMSTGEPGFSFNFFDKENETLRNACTEVTSEDDSDVCNLGSINLSRVSSLDELRDVVHLGTLFLLCGTLRAQLPYDKVYDVRAKNRRLGLGLMGVHEWLLQRGYRYECTDELRSWLTVYRGESDRTAKVGSERLAVSQPVAVRSIAPTGSIGILAGTTTGIEPVYAVAYKRRYLKGTRWHYQYQVDHAAQQIIESTGIAPERVESAIDLAADYERRIKFQADVQDFVDMSISSTINLPAWGTELNNEGLVRDFAATLAKYSSRIRGFTCYPDGARGGQPLVSVPYSEAKEGLGTEFEEGLVMNDVCELTGSGYCGT